jgi:hypothetical protein
MTLVETGTRALLGAVFGFTAGGELTWARKLLHLLDNVAAGPAITPNAVAGVSRTTPRCTETGRRSRWSAG